MKIGLVLEGGGMRGIYTAGVLEYLMEDNIDVNYCIGVSAGACNGVSYVSKQRGRNKVVDTKYIDDKRYISIGNFIKTKSLFGMDFIFDEIPNKLEPFDYNKFNASPCEFVVGVTDAISGKTVYFTKDYMKKDARVIRASSSIPVFSPIVEYKGGKYLDGGTSDPIPVRKALDDGCDKVIIVLTRHRQYRKSPEKMKRLYNRVLKEYPNMISILDNRHRIYNETLDYVKELENRGIAIVIAPSQELKISRFEKDKDKLLQVYDLGYNNCRDKKEEILKFLED